jgi:hypothetical protein
MNELATRAWSLFDHAVENASVVVVRPSIPILYFGDSEAYRSSPLKVVTVGLNPSRREFSSADPWARFMGGNTLSAQTPMEYLRTLDSYFVTKPYDNWFASFEWLLRGMGASYYGGPSVALHTDICSPVATNPTWNRLNGNHFRLGDGFALWRDLVEELAPDVVLASVAQRYLLRLTPEPADTWPTVFTLERSNPYHVRTRKVTIGGHGVPVVFGRAAQKPFGTVGHREKEIIGAAIRKALGG